LTTLESELRLEVAVVFISAAPAIAAFRRAGALASLEWERLRGWSHRLFRAHRVLSGLKEV